MSTPKTLCSVCGKRRPATEFYARKDGRPRRDCKACVRERAGRRYEANREAVIASAVEWNRKNPERRKAIKRRYYQRHRAAELEDQRTRRRAAPEKSRARTAVAVAVAKRRLSRPKRCPRCKVTGRRIEGHHPDYSRPLDVTWVCTVCHRALEAS